MIAIVSSDVQERIAFATLCESSGWLSFECDSLYKLKRQLTKSQPNIVLTRYKLHDGYSDDVIRYLETSGLRAGLRIIVLVGAGTPSTQEARQVSLGADLVHRDPVRVEVISAYISHFLKALKGSAARHAKALDSFPFAGAKVNFVQRTLHHSGKTVALAPREIELVQFLFEARAKVVTYDMLYSEILGRRFRGDTSNMRVLLGKLAASFESVGLPLRPWIEVIPKTGYRYRAASDSLSAAR